MNWKILVVSLCAAAIGVSAVSAQACEAVSTSLTALAATCAGLTRGDLCQDGTITPIGSTDSVSVETAALGRLQANYPDVDAAQFVGMALIGRLSIHTDALLSTEVFPPRVPIQVNVTGTGANVRARPGGAILAKFKFGSLLTATGISSNGLWLRIQFPGQPTEAAWISRSVISSNYDLTRLTTVSADTPVPPYPEYTPMQAFSFTGTSPCSGIVAQSGDNPAQITVNGIALQLNAATAFLQNTGDALVINVLDGIVQVQTPDGAVSSIAGTVVRVPLNEAGQASGAPSDPVAYDDTALAALAGSYLPIAVTVAPAANSDAIQSALTTPLSGVWETTYPLSSDSKEGGDCANFTSAGSVTWIVQVADDGSTFSVQVPSKPLQTAVRSVRNIYMLQEIQLQVLSPTEMTATYDLDSSAACTNIITITSQWVGPGN